MNAPAAPGLSRTDFDLACYAFQDPTGPVLRLRLQLSAPQPMETIDVKIDAHATCDPARTGVEAMKLAAERAGFKAA